MDRGGSRGSVGRPHPTRGRRRASRQGQRHIKPEGQCSQAPKMPLTWHGHSHRIGDPGSLLWPFGRPFASQPGLTLGFRGPGWAKPFTASPRSVPTHFTLQMACQWTVLGHGRRWGWTLDYLVWAFWGHVGGLGGLPTHEQRSSLQGLCSPAYTSRRATPQRCGAPHRMAEMCGRILAWAVGVFLAHSGPFWPRIACVGASGKGDGRAGAATG